jgi:hypothetical protein
LRAACQTERLSPPVGAPFVPLNLPPRLRLVQVRVLSFAVSVDEVRKFIARTSVMSEKPFSSLLTPPSQVVSPKYNFFKFLRGAEVNLLTRLYLDGLPVTGLRPIRDPWRAMTQSLVDRPITLNNPDDLAAPVLGGWVESLIGIGGERHGISQGQ